MYMLLYIPSTSTLYTLFYKPLLLMLHVCTTVPMHILATAAI